MTLSTAVILAYARNMKMLLYECYVLILEFWQILVSLIKRKKKGNDE